MRYYWRDRGRAWKKHCHRNPGLIRRLGCCQRRRNKVHCLRSLSIFDCISKPKDATADEMMAVLKKAFPYREAEGVRKYGHDPSQQELHFEAADEKRDQVFYRRGRKAARIDLGQSFQRWGLTAPPSCTTHARCGRNRDRFPRVRLPLPTQRSLDMNY
jgi:hypothetical protein